MNNRKFVWYFFVFLCISIGLYPISYLVADMSQGLLGTKSQEILSQFEYLLIFYLHISFGGISLLIGWSQFVKSFRNKNLSLHRLLGKTYIVSVLISGVSGFYIALHATGGLPSVIGFSSLSILWILTTILAFRAIINKKQTSHEQWMIRSYGLTFAAVTLRLWMPVLIGGAGLDFFVAYPIIAWLCWIPNIIFAELIIVRLKSK